jgi:hypothetical protein
MVGRTLSVLRSCNRTEDCADHITPLIKPHLMRPAEQVEVLESDGEEAHEECVVLVVSSVA